MPSQDPYKDKSEQDTTPQKKVEELQEILKLAKFGMLTTRAESGELNTRAMAPASTENLTFSFTTNNTTYKVKAIEKDPRVSIAFIDPTSTSWISVTGKATVSSDRELIKKLWSPLVSAWFGDLGDGVHKGDENDPRVSVIQVVPDQIRYWYATKTRVGQMAEIVTSAMTGETASPGYLRTMDKLEIQLIAGQHAMP